jgi:hypothetical protein
MGMCVDRDGEAAMTDELEHKLQEMTDSAARLISSRKDRARDLARDRAREDSRIHSQIDWLLGL